MHKNVQKLLNGDTVHTRLEVKCAIGSENDGDWKETSGVGLESNLLLEARQLQC